MRNKVDTNLSRWNKKSHEKAGSAGGQSLDMRTARAWYIINLASDLPGKSNFNSPERNFANARPSWSQMASEPQLRLSRSEVSWCSRRDPTPHWHLPELLSPANVGLPAAAHREETALVPHDTNLCLILLERRWSKVEGPWHRAGHPMGKSKAQVHTLFQCGPLHVTCFTSSAEKILGFDPQKGQEGTKRQASKIISSPLHQERIWICRR